MRQIWSICRVKHFTNYIEDIGFSGKDVLPHLWDVYMGLQIAVPHF